MTTLVLLPIALGLVLSGAAIGWPAARAAGFRAATRDSRDVARILGGVGTVDYAQPSRYGGIHRAAPWWWTFRDRGGEGSNPEAVAWPALCRRLRDEALLHELAQRERAEPPGTTTQEFQRITADLDLDWRCDSCRGLIDLEKAHTSCGGCACPCTVVAGLIGQPDHGFIGAAGFPDEVSGVEDRQPEVSAHAARA